MSVLAARLPYRRKFDIVIVTIILISIFWVNVGLLFRSMERKAFESQISGEMVRLRSQLSAADQRQSSDETRQALRAALRGLEYRLLNVGR